MRISVYKAQGNSVLFPYVICPLYADSDESCAVALADTVGIINVVAHDHHLEGDLVAFSGKFTKEGEQYTDEMLRCPILDTRPEGWTRMGIDTDLGWVSKMTRLKVSRASTVILRPGGRGDAKDVHYTILEEDVALLEGYSLRGTG